MSRSQDTGHNSDRWQQNLDVLRGYVEREGHARVPVDWIEQIPGSPDVALGAWVSYARQRYRKGLLSPARIDELAGLPGWEWGPLRPGPDPDHERNSEMRALRARGTSLQHIADAYGLSRQRVHQIVGDVIVERRPSSEAASGT